MEEGEKKIDKLTERVPVPWKGTDVLIVGHRHLKGKVGMVTDVHICKSSPSGLVIEVALGVYDPAIPFKRVRVDYSQVVELKFVLLCFPPF